MIETKHISSKTKKKQTTITESEKVNPLLCCCCACCLNKSSCNMSLKNSFIPCNDNHAHYHYGPILQTVSLVNGSQTILEAKNKKIHNHHVNFLGKQPIQQVAILTSGKRTRVTLSMEFSFKCGFTLKITLIIGKINFFILNDHFLFNCTNFVKFYLLLFYFFKKSSIS